MEYFAKEIQVVNDRSTELDHYSKHVMHLASQGLQFITETEQQMNRIHREVIRSVDQLKGLDSKVKEITALVQVIMEIAEQTHLLALNASIESARAGEHGKGFAVVAGEIRKLAEKVSGSVETIVNIVEGVQGESHETVSALQRGYLLIEEETAKIKTTKETFDEINRSILNVREQIQHISAKMNAFSEEGSELQNALESIAAIVEQTAASIEQTNAIMQESGSLIYQIASESESMERLSQELKRSVGHFRLP
jgi:methyl-accepting chemotaxis protein